jgi:DNA-binding GntR family transcriptional regulator
MGSLRVPVIRPPTLTEAVLQQLRQLVIKGGFAPGAPIRVDQVAAEFGVSALPVREALRVLVAEGRVEYSPHRGYRMATLSFADVVEIFLMCRVLEGEALRRGVPAMGDEGATRMRELLAELESGAADHGLWDRVAIHQDFHFVPVQYAGLPRIELKLRQLWDHTDHYRSLYFFHDDRQASLVYEDHHELVHACVVGDGDLAVAVMDRHRDHVLERVRLAMDDASRRQGVAP